MIEINFMDNAKSDSVELDTVFSFLALIISIITLFGSAFYNKRADVINNKFDKLCLSIVEKYLLEIERILMSNSQNKLFEITDQLSDLQLYLLYLEQNVYLNIDLEFLSDLTDTFSDQIYSIHNQNTNLISAKSDLFKYKILLINSLYKFALSKELNLLERIKNKMQKYN
jgi:hypothetical protein